jgi:hypothetical protein
MQIRLQNYLQNSVYYPSIDINNSLQDGLDEIVAFTGCVYKSAVIPFTQFVTYYDLLTLLPDYVGLVAMFNSVIRRWMFPRTLKKFNQDRIDWDTAFGTPYWFAPINHRYVAIYLKPGTAGYGNMLVFYVAAAPQITDSTFLPIPDEHLTVLENYSATDLWEQGQEFSKAEPYLKSYIESLGDLRKLVKSQRNRDRYMGLH